MFRPLRPLIVRARVLFRNPDILDLSRPERRLIYLNTPDRLDKFIPNHKSYTQRKKTNTFQVPFNNHLPYLLDGNKESNYLYGNPPLINHKTLKFPAELRAPVKKYDNFAVSTDDLSKISLTDEFIIKDINNGLSRKNLQYLMQNDYYVRLKQEDSKRKKLTEKKYWFPASNDVLDAVITAEKLYEFVSFDPLDPFSTIKPPKLTKIPLTDTEKQNLINDRYHRLNRAKDLFILFGVSKYNLNTFRHFLLAELADINNLYSLSHTKYGGYKATYIIPVGFVSNNPKDFLNNGIVQFYTRLNVERTERFDELIFDVDPEYRKIKLTPKAPEDYTSLQIPKNSFFNENENFLQNVDFSLKKESQNVKQYYLTVVLQSDTEIHESESPTCNLEGWYYRPELYGRLISIIPEQYKYLSLNQKEFIENRVQNKGKSTKLKL